VDEHSQTDGFVRETDDFTYAIDKDGDLLWFIRRVCTTAGGSAKTRQPSCRPSRTLKKLAADAQATNRSN
jgi:hypothetical protein